MSKKTTRRHRQKAALNANLAPRLRDYLDAFVRMNDRKSAVSVIEEALREFFAKRGINTDTPAEDMLRQIIAEHAAKSNRSATSPKES